VYVCGVCVCLCVCICVCECECVGVFKIHPIVLHHITVNMFTAVNHNELY